MYDTLIVQFLQAFAYLLQETTNELLSHRLLLPLCHDIVPQTRAQILANDVYVPVFLEVIDQFSAELALFDGLKHSKLLEKISFLLLVSCRNEFHLELFTREPVPDEPPLTELVLRQLADQFVLINVFSELLGA